MWSTCLYFELDCASGDLDDLLDWLQARAIPCDLRVVAEGHGASLLFSVRLGADHATEAVYLSLWPGCVGAKPVAQPACANRPAF